VSGNRVIHASDAYTLAVAVVEGLELNNVRMADYAHDLEFSVL
jgi:hypothetical protein